MTTVKQMQRLWNTKAYGRLLEGLIAPRAEASTRLVEQLLSQQLNNQTGALAAAAMAIIRLDEMAQAYVPFYSELVRMIVSAQLPNGGWGDVTATAICLRSLMCGQGHGSAIDRGLLSLSQLQKAEGIWPLIPVRRMPIDAFASAFVLMQLGDSPAFRQAVQFEAAVEWFDSHQPSLDEPTCKLWTRARHRCVLARQSTMRPVPQSSTAALWPLNLVGASLT